MSDDMPAWLKAAQNGSIGEARTRAFLLDRFWVLERSVDIDGADFIIQRRLTRATLLDRTPPRLGVVQVKFFDSDGTTHYVHREYVMQPDSQPRTEFFLMCHTGGEEDAVAFLITAKELLESFECVGEGKTNAGKYRIGGVQLLGSKKYAVQNKRLALDRIEHTLQLADFVNNRSFMSWLLPSARITPEAIDPIYREPLENAWGNIPRAFVKLKEKSQTALYALEEIHEKFVKIIEATDPEQAFEVIEQIRYECKGGYGWSVSLPDDLLDEDFQAAVVEHKEKVQNLKARGSLDAFVDFNRTIKRAIACQLAPYMPLAREKVQVVTIRYDAETLANVVVTSAIESANQYRPSPAVGICSQALMGELECWRGYIRIWWCPGGYMHERKETQTWQDYIEGHFWAVYRHIMESLYQLHFGSVTS
jgi:hypothetical protein